MTFPTVTYVTQSAPTIDAPWLNAVNAICVTWDGVFGTATTAAQMRTALGSTATGDSLFTAASAAAARTTLSAFATTGGTLTGSLTMSGKSIIEAEGAAVTAAATTDIWTAADGNTIHVTGNTGITSFGTAPQAGAWMRVIFDGTPTLTHSANLSLNNNGSNITAAAGDIALVYADTTTQLNVFFIRKSGQAISTLSPSQITASLGADVALNNTANYFDGPSIAQGSTGTWFVSGTVTVEDTTAGSVFYAKLWDGTTVIASTVVQSNATGQATISLSGYLATPAGNLRISVRDTSNTTGKIIFNDSGNSKDSTISACRIA